MNEKSHSKRNRLLAQLHCGDRDHDICHSGKHNLLGIWTLFIFVATLCAFAIFHEITSIGD